MDLELEKLKLGNKSPSSFSSSKTRSTMKELSGSFHPFISYCSLFPPDCKFSKRELVSLWVAHGLFGDSAQREKEDEMFDALVSMEVVVVSGYDPCLDFSPERARTRWLYKVNHSKEKFFDLEFATILDGNLGNVPDNVKHLSIDSKSISDVGFESLRRFQDLQTLLLIPISEFDVEYVPRGLFLSLKELRYLNLSRSMLSELPSSIRNLKSLQYLHISHTPIRYLPPAITRLCNLQTLVLGGCRKLSSLPTGVGMLTNLRHLDIDVIGQLNSMPPAMGNLTKLETLSSFVVGKEDGCGIKELKNMVNLRGAFCISRIENVFSSEEALEVDLNTKKYLRSLHLHWTESVKDEAGKQKKILQLLRPPVGLEELKIVCYSGSKLPCWISAPYYEHLVDMTFFYCMYCERLPSIGKLPSLQFLHIEGMNKIQKIDGRFCREEESQQYHAFPSLKEFSRGYACFGRVDRSTNGGLPMLA